MHLNEIYFAVILVLLEDLYSAEGTGRYAISTIVFILTKAGKDLSLTHMGNKIAGIV